MKKQVFYVILNMLYLKSKLIIFSEVRFAIQEALNTQIKDNYDVVVCGGGVAGIAVAIAAAI